LFEVGLVNKGITKDKTVGMNWRKHRSYKNRCWIGLWGSVL